MSEIGYNGRDYQIQIGNPPETIAAVQAREITRAREGVDVTNDDSDGWRTILPKPGVRTIDINVSGVATQENYTKFIKTWNNDTLHDVTILGPDGSSETGSFFMSNLANGGESSGFVTFTADLQSSGEITFDDGETT